MGLDKESAAYERHRERMAERQRNARAKAADISEIPPIKNPERREECKDSLKLFCETYRPSAFNLGWSSDHLRVIDRIEDTAKNGGLYGLAMPRGNGKTTISVTAAIWAMLYGYRRWVCLVGATSDKANSLLKGIKTLLRFSPELLEDFPEVCVPVRALEGKATRANGQTFNGKETGIEWLSDKVVFPTIEGSMCSGSVITVAGITGDIRGQQATTPDGEVIRPDYVLLDDPQTRESAKSTQQVKDRLATLNGDILGLAGPGVKISGVMPCTVVRRDDMADQILDRKQNPEWHGERTSLLKGWPKNINLWTQYKEKREAEFENGGSGEEATLFYIENQAAMDEGCQASWADRYNPDEFSAIQNAMNLYFRDEEAFFAEYQNEPVQEEEDSALSLKEITNRQSLLKQGQASSKTEKLVGFIDVQKEALYYCVIGFDGHFTGNIIDYGAFPEQKTRNFRYSKITRPLSKVYPDESLEVRLTRALKELTTKLIGNPFIAEDGREVMLDKVLIDANWGLSRDLVYNFCRNSSFRGILSPSHGRYVGASTPPLNARVAKKVGQRIGHHWRMDKSKDSVIQHVIYDTNFWKTFYMTRFASEPGTSGSITLFRDSPRNHDTFARNMLSEKPVRVQGRGRSVDEWKEKPERYDNHWFDCAVGCCVAASIVGVKLPAMASKKTGVRRRKRKRVSKL